jgi:hypothetical protein
MSFRREEKSHYVISTRGEISLCHFDERRNLALSFRREEKSRFVISRHVLPTLGAMSVIEMIKARFLFTAK